MVFTLISAIPGTHESTKSVVLQASGNISEPVLKQSADIISARLKLYGMNSFDIKVSNEKRQVVLVVPAKTNIKEIEGLLTSKGELSFYETYTKDEIIDLFRNDNQLFKILSRDHMLSTSDPRVGCTDSENLKKAETYVQSVKSVTNCKLTWSNESAKSGYCLFALKTNNEGKAFIGRADIKSVKAVAGKDPGDLKIQINLKPSAFSIFADATKRNLHKSIAIVIDDKVNSWPVVQSVIEGGEIEVTGDFNEKDVKFFPVIFNTEELPLSFTIIK